MTLKRSYATEAEVPTERKADYVPRDGRYVLDVEGVESIDGLLAKRDELLGKVSGHASELNTKQAEIDRLTGELSNARGSSLPRGHKAVPNADAELIEAVKAAGITDAAALTTLKTEHGDYKQKAEAAERRKYLDDLRKKLGWNEDAVEVLGMIPTLPDTEDRDAQVNGETKKVPHANLVTKTTTGDEVSYKPFADYFAEKHKALLPAVVTKSEDGGTELPGHGAGGGGGEKSFAADIIKNKYTPKQPAA